MFLAVTSVFAGALPRKVALAVCDHDTAGAQAIAATDVLTRPASIFFLKCTDTFMITLPGENFDATIAPVDEAQVKFAPQESRTTISQPSVCADAGDGSTPSIRSANCSRALRPRSTMRTRTVVSVGVT